MATRPAVGPQERVFDRFHRRGGGQQAGSGLGLAIVNAIAERHSAEVALRDTPAGGLTVPIDFPAPAAVPGPARSAPSGVPRAPPNEDGRP